VTKAQKTLPPVMLGVILLAVAWSFLPFEFTSGVGCGPPLLGAKPDNATPVGLIEPEKDCKSKAKSRLLVSAMISLAAAGAGTAAVALKPISTQCLNGSHDDCPDWWPNLLSERFEGLGCQCECHGAPGPW
jgi:hypothetical protein